MLPGVIYDVGFVIRMNSRRYSVAAPPTTPPFLCKQSQSDNNKYYRRPNIQSEKDNYFVVVKSGTVIISIPFFSRGFTLQCLTCGVATHADVLWARKACSSWRLSRLLSVLPSDCRTARPASYIDAGGVTGDMACRWLGMEFAGVKMSFTNGIDSFGNPERFLTEERNFAVLDMNTPK